MVLRMTSFANGSVKRVPRSRAKVGTISTFIECTKVGATKRINRARRECGLPGRSYSNSEHDIKYPQRGQIILQPRASSRLEHTGQN